MQAVLWWLIPLGATALAIAWVAWASRPRPPADPHDTVAEHERFRAAMDRRTAAGQRDHDDDPPPPADDTGTAGPDDGDRR